MLPGTSPEGYSLPKLPTPLATLDLCKSPEAKKARISLKSRFGKPTKSLATYQLRHVPKNTEVLEYSMGSIS